MKKVNLSIEKKSYATREAVRTLRTNLQFCGDDKRVILVTSCVPGEGKTSVSVSLAESIADMGKSVILVDADIRKSVMASRLGITGVEKGLSHFLSGQCVLADVIVATNIPKFHILLSGPQAPNPTELLESKRFSGMLESMKNVYDYIIIDCGLKHELLTINALAAADYCIIPVQAHFLASEGIPDVLEMVKNVQNRFNPNLKIAGILLTMYQSRPQLCQSVRNSVNDIYGESLHVFERPIEQTIKTAECPAAGMSILDYAPKNPAAESYRSLALEVLHLA